MLRIRSVFGMIGLIFLLPALIACGRRETESRTQPTKPLEVVVFSTPEPTTPTPPPPTNTPQPTATRVVQAQEPTPTPTPTAGLTRAKNENPLTGLIVADPVVLKRRPLHVRIGNDSEARPQVNLSQADLVYEEIVEWWITRLTAVFYSTAPEVVGPVRSARLINGQLTQQYNAGLINSGGSDGVRWELSQLPIVNLDEYFHPKPYFYREGEPWQRRLAVNIAEAYTYMDTQDLAASVALRGFAFAPEPDQGGESAETLFIDYPSKTAKVSWQYNANSGEYERYVAGDPFIDVAVNKIVSAPNVIVYFAEHADTDIVEDSTGATSVRIDINGEGDAWIFRDGLVFKGRWRSDGSQTPEFLEADGSPLPLKPGRSWIQVVPTDYEILVNQ